MKIFHNLFIISLVLLLFGCSYEDTRIPYVSVSLRLNVDTNDRVLKDQLGYKRYVNTPDTKIPSSYPFSISDLTGYGGILVAHGLDGNLHAFDLSCPVEAMVGVRINVVDEGLNAECPKCGSKYEIAQDRKSTRLNSSH